MNSIIIKATGFVTILGLSLFFSCNDKWKQPTDVGFIVDLNYSSGMSGKLFFTGGEITLANFSFNGDRVQGDDVYFMNTFSSGLKIIFNPNTPVESLNFDIPQGTYTKMSITYETYGANNEVQLKTMGSYQKTGSDTIFSVYFEYKATILYSIFAQNSHGSAEVVLNKDTPVNARITFDPIYWFQPVSANLFNSAEVIDIGGTPTILINDTCNENIYSIVADRIDNGSRIVF